MLRGKKIVREIALLNCKLHAVLMTGKQLTWHFKNWLSPKPIALINTCASDQFLNDGKNYLAVICHSVLFYNINPSVSGIYTIRCPSR